MTPAEHIAALEAEDDLTALAPANSPGDAAAPVSMEDLFLAELELPELADSAEEAEMLATANLYLGALDGLEIERASAEAEHLATVALLRQRHERRVAQLEDRMGFLRGLLERVFRAYPPTKGKSRKLLNGTIGTRSRPARLAIEDANTVVAWAREHAPDLIEEETRYRVPAKALNARFAEELKSGAGAPVIPGVTPVPASDEFYVKARAARRVDDGEAA